jgi:hypothetical protein
MNLLVSIIDDLPQVWQDFLAGMLMLVKKILFCEKWRISSYCVAQMTTGIGATPDSEWVSGTGVWRW